MPPIHCDATYKLFMNFRHVKSSKRIRFWWIRYIAHLHTDSHVTEASIAIA
jgi:hypothetical protein